MTDAQPKRRRAPGAGRKPRYPGYQRHTLYLPDEVYQALQDLGRGDVSQGAVRMYDEYRLLARALEQTAAVLPDGEYTKREEGK